MTFNKIFYEQQPNDYTCGPTVIRMALRSLGIDAKDISSLSKILCTTPESGTSLESLTQYIANVAREEKLSFLVAENASLRMLQELSEQAWIVIITYLEPEEDEGHYAVLQSATSDQLVLADPYHGPDFIVKVTDFRWETRYESIPRNGWLCALRKN